MNNLDLPQAQQSYSSNDKHQEQPAVQIPDEESVKELDAEEMLYRCDEEPEHEMKESDFYEESEELKD